MVAGAPDIAVALDGMTLDESVDLVDGLGPECTCVKVGLELYTRAGPDAVRRFKDAGKSVFLDIKLHDIPNTVAGAVRAAATQGADLVTVHASGGDSMVRAAARATDESGSGLRIIAVTVLTSMDEDALKQAWGWDGPVDVPGHVERLARGAVDAGAHGVVSSVLEARALRSELGPEAILVTPGIRLAGDSAHDQARVASPADAAAAGASLLVIGRSITRSSDPRAALERARRELSGTGVGR